MLVIWGVALVVLACVFARDASIAPIFAFTGVASVVLGILAARFEGDFELSATRLKGRLLVVAEREDLTLEDKGDELVRIAEEEMPARAEVQAGTRQPRTGSSVAMQRSLVFEERAMDLFRGKGWEIQEINPAAQAFGDFIAKMGNEAVLVEVKARWRLSAADMRQIVGAAACVREIDQTRNLRLAIVVPAGSLTATARRALRASGLTVEVIEIPEEASP